MKVRVIDAVMPASATSKASPWDVFVRDEVAAIRALACAAARQARLACHADAARDHAAGVAGASAGLCDGPPAQADGGPSKTAAAGGLRILLVEDSFLLAMQLEALFEGIGWTVVGPATHTAQAMALAGTVRCDVALLDINLNGEMSWDVADALTRRGIPFLFSTGYDVRSVLPEHLAGSPIIGKPFGNQVIELALRRVVADARAGRPARETAAWIAAGGARTGAARID